MLLIWIPILLYAPTLIVLVLNWWSTLIMLLIIRCNIGVILIILVIFRIWLIIYSAKSLMYIRILFGISNIFDSLLIEVTATIRCRFIRIIMIIINLRLLHPISFIHHFILCCIKWSLLISIFISILLYFIWWTFYCFIWIAVMLLNCTSSCCRT